jgi:hypothetical protein
MASVRSISTSKSPERLLTQRLNRTSNPTATLPPRKLTLPKTTSITLSTSRQKTSRMPLKKGAIGSTTSPARLNTCSTPTDNIESTTDKMASTTIHDLHSIRSRSRVSEGTDISISQDNSTTLLSNDQFTLESFDTIRTVGTGKNFFRKIFLLNFDLV